MRRILMVAVLLAMPQLCWSAVAPYAPGHAPYVQHGRASYYGLKHDGKRTADGSRFDETDFTAAHPTLPFGTVVRVTNLSNGRMVKVRITDRGPHGHGRVIDVSDAAARELSMHRRGIARVKIVAMPDDQP